MSSSVGSGEGSSPSQYEYDALIGSLEGLKSAGVNFIYDKIATKFIDPNTTGSSGSDDKTSTFFVGLRDISDRITKVTRQLETEMHAAGQSYDKDKIAILKEKITRLRALIDDPTLGIHLAELSKQTPGILSKLSGVWAKIFKAVPEEPWEAVQQELLHFQKRASATVAPIADMAARTEDEVDSVHKAATTIQKNVRGRLVRRAHLPRGFYSNYSAQCAKIGMNMPRARAGQTRVYLPTEMTDVVLKESGRKNAITRFHQMQQVRGILQSQNCSHLVIPRASLFKEFLVEQRLPINVDTYHNISLYLAEPQAFDDAVREMTRLFSKVYLSDLLQSYINPMNRIPGVGDGVRYDNLPLYVVENRGNKEGRIGLIDLEHIQKGGSVFHLYTLARIFPLHVDIIREEAEKLGMRPDDLQMQQATDRGKKYLQVGYLDHVHWCKEKGITADTATQIFEGSPEKEDVLTAIIEKELIKLNGGENSYYVKAGISGPPKDVFKETPEDVAKELAPKICHLLLDNLHKGLKKNQTQWLERMGGQITCESEIINFRSPVLKREEICKGVLKLIVSHPKVGQDKYWDLSGGTFDYPVLFAFMNELVKSKDLFSFDPAYYSGGHNLCWVRY